MEPAMPLKLPEPIAAYFATDRRDGEAVARCFTKDAVVKDEGRTHAGVAAIRQWKEEASAKYTYTCEPLRLEQQGDVSVVTCRLEGNFPGGKADLRFFFRLERGKISSLEIVP
jgi:ketosteroid isomerase-like protein